MKVSKKRKMKEAVRLTGEQVKNPRAFEKEFQGGDTFKEMKGGFRLTAKQAQHILKNADFEKMIMEAKDDKEVAELINDTESLRKVAEQLTPEKHKQILKNVSPTKKGLKRKQKRNLDTQMQNIKKGQNRLSPEEMGDAFTMGKLVDRSTMGSPPATAEEIRRGFRRI